MSKAQQAPLPSMAAHIMGTTPPSLRSLDSSSPTIPAPRRRPCLLNPFLILPTDSLVLKTGWVYHENLAPENIRKFV